MLEPALRRAVPPFAATLLLLVVAGPAAAQGSPDLDALRARPEFRVLAGMHVFYGRDVRKGGEPSSGMLALRLLLEQRGARDAFVRLLDEAPPGGQLYALCGLWLLDPETFAARVGPFLTDEREVEVTPGRCYGVSAQVRDLVRSESPWAVRLEQGDRDRATCGGWIQEQGWPAQANPVLDVVGGGLPVTLGRYDDWGRPWSGLRGLPVEQRSLAFWIDELTRSEEERRAPDEDVAEMLSCFGAAAADAAAALLEHSEAGVRRDAAQVYGFLGVPGLGARAGEAAVRLGRLLYDSDPRVRLAAAGALAELGPWSAPALLDVISALERLPAQPDERLQEAARRLMGAAWASGGAPVPRLVSLARHLNPHVRSFAVRALGAARADAGAAGVALCDLLDDAEPDLRAEAAQAMGALAGSDLAATTGRTAATAARFPLGAPEVGRLRAALQDDVPGVVRASAKALASCGARAGEASADALTAALSRSEDVHLRAELMWARWRITGRADGLVGALLDSRASNQYGAAGGLLDEVLRDDPERVRDLALALRAPLPHDEDAPAATRAKLALMHLRWLGPAATTAAPEVRLLFEAHGSAHWISKPAAETLHCLSGETGPSLRVALTWLRRDDAESREEGLVLLERLGPAAAAALPDLTALLRAGDVSSDVIACGVRVLVACGPAAADVSVPLLNELMSEPRIHVQIAARWGLARLATVPAAREALERAITSPDGELARRARLALEGAGAGPGER